MARVAVIGLGEMGSRIARRLVDAGHVLTVWNRTREKAFEVLGTTALAAQAERRRPVIESGEYPPRFPLRLARKDADLIAELGLDLRLTEAGRSWLAEAGDGEQDYSAVLAGITRR